MDGQCAATRLADDRHEADLRRVLLDVDRERSATAKLQKELEQAKRQLAEQADRHRAQAAQLQDELDSMRQKLSGSKAGFAQTRAANDQLRAHLDKALAGQLARRPQRDRRKFNSQPALDDGIVTT